MNSLYNIYQVLFPPCWYSLPYFNIYKPVLCDELFHKFIHRRERSKFASSRYPLLCLGNDFENIWKHLGNILEIWCMERGALLRGAGGAGQGALQGWPDLKKWVFFNGFSLYLGLKMNIFQKKKHESYSTFGELSNAFYRFLKFEFHQELWAKNSEILTLKSGFSFFFGSKINIFQKMKHQSYSSSWELSNAFYRFQKFKLYQELWAKNSKISPSVKAS